MASQKGSSQGSSKGSSKGPYKGSSKGSSQGPSQRSSQDPLQGPSSQVFSQGPSQGSSQGSSCPLSQRYKQVIEPIRDPLKNFDVDVVDLLQNYMENLEYVSNSQADNRNPFVLNFSEAALVVQGSSCCYGKKVDHLHHLTQQLVQAVHNEKKSGSSGKSKDLLLAGRHNDEDFCLADDIAYVQTDPVVHNLVSAEQKYNSMVTRLVPLSLMPLDEKEKGDINIKTISGEVMGKTKDLQVEVCNVLYEGCTFLPTIVFKDRFGDASFSNSTFYHTRISDDALNNMSCSSLSPIGAPSSNDLLSNDIDMEDNFSVHDDPIMDSPIACDTPPNLPTVNGNGSQVPPDQRNGVQTRRRSERHAAKVAKLKEEKKNKNPWAVSTDQLKDRIVPLVTGDTRAPAKEKPQLPKVKPPRSSIEFINEMRNRKRRTIAYLKVCPLDSKILKNMPAQANVGINTIFQVIATFVCKYELSLKKKVRQKVDIDRQDSLEMDEPPIIGQNGHTTPIVPISPKAPELNSIESEDDEGGFPPDIPDDISEHENSPEDGTPVMFEAILRNHVNNYLKGTKKFTTNTELSDRVKEWEDKIKPVIKDENQREAFNIHHYGTRIIDKFENNNRKQTLPLALICQGKQKWEVCRYFASSLILANHNNLEITSSIEPSGLHEVYLTLLSRKRHQEALEAFGHNLGEHE